MINRIIALCQININDGISVKPISIYKISKTTKEFSMPMRINEIIKTTKKSTIITESIHPYFHFVARNIEYNQIVVKSISSVHLQ